MGHGIVVPAAGGQLPSQHFGRHLDFAKDPLHALVAGLIDGQQVHVDGDDGPLAVIKKDSDGKYGCVAFVDTGEGAQVEAAFVIELRAVSAGTPASGSSDPRGVPTVLADFQSGVIWDLYNCVVDVQVWKKADIYANRWPGD